MMIINKYKGFPQTAKATFWFLICNIILKGISFITVPLFTRFLSTNQYGAFSIFSSYQQIIIIFATLELPLGAYQRGILKFKDDINRFTSSIIFLCNIITIIVFMILMPLKGYLLDNIDVESTAFYLLFIYIIVQPVYNTWINYKRFNYEYKPVVISTLGLAIISTSVSLLAVVKYSPTANVRIISSLIVSIIFCLPYYIKLFHPIMLIKNYKKIISFWKFSLSFQLPLVLHSLSFLILAQADRIMIGNLVGKSEAAIYSVAYSLASTIIIIQTAINDVFRPWRYKKLESKEYKQISQVTYQLFAIIGLVALIFIISAPEVLNILFLPSYYSAVWTIPPVSLSVFFMLMYTVFTDIESYFLETKYIMYASIICASINIILNYFGIKWFGYIACGYTTLISYILFAFFHYWFMRKVCKKVSCEKIFDGKKLITIAFVFIVLMIVFTFMYECFVIRYIIAIAILILCFANRRKVMDVFIGAKCDFIRK